MKAEFHGPCEVVVICECGTKLEIIEIQHKGCYKTLYTEKCETCINNAYEGGILDADFNE